MAPSGTLLERWIRIGDWKLIDAYETGKLSLYNLVDDIGETNDLSESNPEKLDELKKDLERWRDEINAPVPSMTNEAFDEEAEAAAIEKALAAAAKKKSKK